MIGRIAILASLLVAGGSFVSAEHYYRSLHHNHTYFRPYQPSVFGYNPGRGHYGHYGRYSRYGAYSHYRAYPGYGALSAYRPYGPYRTYSYRQYAPRASHSRYGYPQTGAPVRAYYLLGRTTTDDYYQPPPPAGPANGPAVVRANYSDLIFSVTPNRALVYVDGKLIGSARSFASYQDRYTLVRGEYDLRIEFPDYQTFQTTLQVVSDRTINLDVQLQPVAER